MPRLRLFLFSILLFAVTAFALREHPALPPFMGGQTAADTPQASAWIEREKKLFGEILASRNHEVLVVPLQAGVHSIDRASRSLMTRMLSAAAGRRTGTSMPDPTWVARAFGATARAIPDEDIHRLAAALGARHVLAGRIALENNRPAMRITVELWEARGGKWQVADRKTLGPLAFDDATPPAVAFQSALDDLVALLPEGAAAAPAISTAPPVSIKLPTDPALLFAPDAASAVEAALRVQLVASLHEPGTIEREHLFERSLMVLGQAGNTDPMTQLLAARAYFHLHHRPYALQVLGTPETAEARAFHAILQGNLPLAEKPLDVIENQALQLIARIEAEDLRNDYDKLKGFERRRERVLAALPDYAPLLGLRFSQADWFNPQATVAVAQALNIPGVPAAQPARKGVAGALLRLAEDLAGSLPFLNYFGAKAVRPAATVEATYPEAMRREAARWEPAADRLAEWDRRDLLYAINRAAFMKAVRSRLFMQALPEQALAMSKAAREAFGGHPRLAYLEAHALNRLAEKEGESGNKELLDSSSRLARDLYLWEGEETLLTYWTEWLIWPRTYEKYLDEPLRPYRAWHKKGQLDFHEGKLPREEMERRVAELRRKLAYTQTDFALVEEIGRLLQDLGRPEDFASLLADTSQRFVANAQRSRFLIGLQQRSGDRAALVRLHESLIAEEPDTWSHYFRLGKLHGEAGNYAEAREVFLSYPLFRQGGENRVELSNAAAQAGRWLYYRGEPELSRPLLQLSVDFHTGASSEMSAAELLAAMEGEWLQAAELARVNVERYNGSDAAHRHITYLFLAGQTQEAWTAFRELQPRHDDGLPWTAALVGHRMAATDDTALKDWILAWSDTDRQKHYLSRALRERFAFLALTADRPVTQETVGALKAITDKNNHSPYYPGIGRGYLALRQGNFNAAIGALEPTSQTLTNISAERKQTLNDMLPYLAYAYARSGRAAEFEAKLATHLAKVGEDFDYLLARAILDALAGQHANAEERLDIAFNRHPPAETRSFYPLYELLELTEWLLRDTGHEGYRNRILDWAKREQQAFPFSWAYSFEAKHAKTRQDRIRALAIALYLDPAAERVRGMPESDLKAANAWLARNNPFSPANL